MPESDAGRRSRSSCSLLPFSLGALRSRGRGGGNFGGAYFSLAGARKVNRATRLYPGPRIRTPGGQGLMSASSAFGSQSSRSPQARAPILALSLSSSLPPACSNPFFLYPFSPPKANPIGTRFYFSRSSRFILHGLPRPTISFHLVHFYSPESTLFTFYPLSNVLPLLASFFFLRFVTMKYHFFFFLLLKFPRVSSNSNSTSLSRDCDCYERSGELKKRFASIDDNAFEMLEIKIDRGVKTAYSSDL